MKTGSYKLLIGLGVSLGIAIIFASILVFLNGVGLW